LSNVNYIIIQGWGISLESRINEIH
jgi:hypothetical protein